MKKQSKSSLNCGLFYVKNNTNSCPVPNFENHHSHNNVVPIRHFSVLKETFA
ncbi:hypothetical protein [uncultured Gammaproteobacteria bacterium]|nr:hypothetical protein [uncultured Gammaproteobacteria bacterium]CAC9654509.1 hypothetical protein [uncultured Gammaproteobacteria bacterium]